jgi:hypothetical protein
MDPETCTPSAVSDAALWDEVLTSLCRLQAVLPDAIVVGGTASALYAGHPMSFDHDHILPDLRPRFDAVLAELEEVAGWQTNRVTRPVQILGSLDGIQTGIRQLRRAAPLDTTEMTIGEYRVRLPTESELVRIKAFLCLDRNATRDYLDLAALTAHLGLDAAAAALEAMDSLYPQKNGNPWIVRTQLVKQLADPRPYDLESNDLAEYKGVKAPFDRWNHIADTCGLLSARLLERCMAGLASDPSPVAGMARVDIEDWRQSRAQGQVRTPVTLPGSNHEASPPHP